MKKSLLIFCVLLVSTSRAQSASDLVINEICASNIDQWVDLSFNYGGWVELYNPTSAEIDITGWYLSDDKDHLKRGRINQTTKVPAKGYVTLWLDHYDWKYSPLTLDMKLDADGGQLFLSNKLGNLITEAEYPEAIARCSWARTNNGGSEWQYCSTPTPTQDNTRGSFASERLDAPQVDIDSRLFSSGRVTFNVTIPEGCELRYTTDGSAPTLTNGQVSVSGQVESTTTKLYRFRLFREGYLPSAVVTRTGLRDSHTIDLPIISIVGTYKNFYGDSLGIFTKGVNGRPGAGQNQKCNWNMDWERPAEFQYFSADGEMLLSQEVGLERCGGWSRAWSPSSFKIKAGKQYEGRKYLDYRFFTEKPRLRHKALQIRNGGNDNGCRIKDAALQQIMASSGIDIDYQAYQPVAQFINGQWKGTINMREPNNKHFVLANYGLDDDRIDQFEMSPDSGYVQKCGTDERWKKLISLSKTASDASSYNQMCQMLDIDEYCYYMAIQFYLDNWDWPQNNVKGWTLREDGGRFRFVVFDLDNSFSGNNPFTTFANKKTYSFDWLYDQNTRYTKEIEMVTLFLNLLNNDSFRQKFIDTFCLVTYSVFEPSVSEEIVTEMANRVAPTQGQYNNESPWSSANSVIQNLGTSHQSKLINYLKNYSRFKLSSTTPKMVSLQSELPEACLSINGMSVPRNTFNGQLFGTTTIETSIPTGYSFAGWRQATQENVVLMASSQTWKYYDQGSLDGLNWQSSDYKDSNWSSGPAPLGYHTDNIRNYSTTLSYGYDKNNKRPCYYFRTTVNLAQKPNNNDKIVLNAMVDDGCVVYVNGVEAARYNMPSGLIYYSTFATTYAPNDPDNCTLTLDPTLFQDGTNVIAVEVHQNSGDSRDVYWSASLEQVKITQGSIISNNARFELPSLNEVRLIATFEQTPATLSSAPVVINEISADNGIYINDFGKKSDWIELYNTTDEEIDIEGMFLTNDMADPEKWQITTSGSNASTLIEPHGYKLIWCDKEESDTELHAPFKLNKGDRHSLMLSASDGSWCDSLTYWNHQAFETIGRYPDGARNVYLMTRPTIEKSNLINRYCYSLGIDGTTEIETINHSVATDDHYAVYNLSGQLITRGKGNFDQQLTSGVYLVKRHNEVFKVMIP